MNYPLYGTQITQILKERNATEDYIQGYLRAVLDTFPLLPVSSIPTFLQKVTEASRTAPLSAGEPPQNFF